VQLIIQTLLPLMLLVVIGAVLKKTIADNSWTEVLNKLAVYLLFPALIFSGMVKVKLESGGWRALPCMEDVFKMENWLVC